MLEISRNKSGDLQKSCAGDTLNTAIYLSRVLYEEKYNIYYVTGIGSDPFSNEMIRYWQQEGIVTELVQSIRGKLPGLYFINTDEGGERSFYYWRDKSAARVFLTGRYAEKLEQRLSQFRLIYLSGITLAIFSQRYRERLAELLDAIRKTGVITVFDSNYRPRLWQSIGEAKRSYQDIYPYIDIALVSFDNEQSVFADPDPKATCYRLSEEGITEVVVKNGTSPCTVLSEDEVSIYPLIEVIKPVDTTAAGDSFNAAYIAARLLGYEIKTAVSVGQRLASKVIQHLGAIISNEATPNIDELR